MAEESAGPRPSDFLLAWEEFRRQGLSVSAEDLCRDCPEQLDTVRRRLSALRAVYRALDADDAGARPGADELPTLARASGPADAAAVPGYEILAEVGRGGMGVVYQARHQRLNRLVALKMILAGGHAADPEHARFHREAEAAARLTHPNIVQIHEVGEAGGRPFLALEFVAGGSLAERVRGVPLPAPAAARLVERLARAMQYAHERGIVHRDLKPANILLQRSEVRGQRSEVKGQRSEEDTARSLSSDLCPLTSDLCPLTSDLCPLTSDLWPKITDFGLAKLLDADPGRTPSGAVLGTPSYMAPEQAQGREVGPAADVYALGAILYELLTGRPPFRAATPVDTVLQVLTDEPVPPRRLQPTTPHDLEVICLRCLAKEPRKRYASAAALADDLARFLAGEPIHARPVGFGERAVKWARRRPAAAALLLVSCAALVGLVGLMAALWRNAEDRAAAVQELAGAQKLLTARQDQLAGLERAVRQEGERLRAARTATRRALYIRDVQLARTALGRREIERLVRLLESHRPGPDQEDVRGFEWHYLWRLCHGGRPLPRGHSATVRSVRFTPDGRALATVDDAAVLKLWDVAAGKELALPAPTPGLVRALSADGLTLATGGADGVVKVWRRTTGQVARTVPAHRAAVSALNLTPDGRLLATAGRDNALRLVDLATGRVRALAEQGAPVTTLVFTPDGTALFAGQGDARWALWDVAGGRERFTSAGPGESWAGFSADGKLLATAARHGVTVRDVATGRVRAALTTRGGAWVTDQDFAPDGRSLAVAEGHPFNPLSAGSVRLLDLATGRPRWSADVPAGGAYSVAFAPDGATLAVGDTNGVVSLLTAATGAVRNEFIGHTQRIGALAFSPDGRTLASADYTGRVRLWATAAPPSPLTFQTPARHVLCLALTPDGRLLATGHENGRIEFWDPVTGQHRATLTGHVREVSRLAFSPDGRTLASSGVDRTVRLWDRRTHKQEALLQGHTAQVSCVAFSPDGRTLASGDHNHTANVKLWDLATRTVRLTLTGHTLHVWFVAFSPDGKVLASSSEDSTVRLWDVATGRLRATLPAHSRGLLSVAFSPPDGKLVAAGDWGASVKVWEAATGKLVADFRGHTGPILPVLFTPDGRTVVSGGTDGTVRLWDLATGHERFTFPGHHFTVGALAMTKDGGMLVSGGGDGLVRVYHAAAP